MLIVKVGYRQAVVHGIIRCLAELAGSGIFAVSTAKVRQGGETIVPQ